MKLLLLVGKVVCVDVLSVVVLLLYYKSESDRCDWGGGQHRQRVRLFQDVSACDHGPVSYSKKDFHNRTTYYSRNNVVCNYRCSLNRICLLMRSYISSSSKKCFTSCFSFFSRR